MMFQILYEFKIKNIPHALIFLIATSARTNEVIGATWKEIDLKIKFGLFLHQE